MVGIAQGEEYDEELLNERQRKHAWFVAFAPYDDPQIALAVLVENGGGGGAVAAPIARKFLEKYFYNRLIPRPAPKTEKEIDTLVTPVNMENFEPIEIFQDPIPEIDEY